MNFGQAIEMLNQGKRVARKGWNGKNMFLFKHQGFETNEVSEFTGNKHDHVPAFICMKAANGDVIFGWFASQTDMLSEDWQEV